MALVAEIQATCSSLGYLEDDAYVKEPDCLESVKDLIRYLKREDDTCDIRRLLGDAQIVQNDLIPIIKASLDDTVLLDTTVRLLDNLTQPAILCFQGYIPTEKTQHNFYLEVLGHLGAYKQAFADEKLFQALCQKLGELLQLDWESRQEEDRLLIERILILIRNVLHIAPLDDDRRTDDDVSCHDQVLWALHTSGMEDLLLYIASSEDERQFAIHILEIVSLMFREQTADQLARAGAGRTMTEKEKDEKELLESRHREKAQRRIATAKYSTRHSRFGGTYVLSDVKSISEKPMIYHRSLRDVNNISYDQGKRPKKLGKNRKPILEDSTSRRSTLSIRLALKHFCIQFLEKCFNPLMNCVKDKLQHCQTDENDETYYIWALRFFMEFQRHYKFRVDVISETMTSNCFHYIHVQIMTYNDNMTTNKNEAKTWGKRLHLALKAYKELLLTLNEMGKGSEEIKESARVLKSNIFYVPEYKDVLIVLLTKFKQSTQSRSYLKDLVETTHVFLKMLESYCSRGRVMVQSKKRAKKKKSRRVQPETNNNVREDSEQIEEVWESISGDLSSLIQGRDEVPDVVSPFDAASEVDIDQQKDDAMFKIHDALRQRRPAEALALLRAARQVWPEQQVFGPEDMDGESEFMAMRQIFFSDLNRNQQSSEPIPPEEENEELSDDEDPEQYVTSEQQFEFKDFLMKLVRPEILKPYVLLISEYNKNSAKMNHYLVKMLHRVSFDCKVPGMLFQLSLFRVFQRLLKDPLAKISHKELLKFAHFIVIKFFEMDNKDAFHEILFWKNVRESLELVDGFGSYQGEKTKSQAWTETEEMELTRLYDDLKDREDPEKDVVDLIMEEIINQNRTRRQIIAKLSHLDLIQSAKDIKKKKAPNRARVWLEEDEAQLQGLFQEHRSDPDVLNKILANLHVKRGKNAVIEKLIGLGLISDRKEVYKRRGKKKDDDLEKPPKSKEFISSSDDSSGDDGGGSSRRNSASSDDNRERKDTGRKKASKKKRRGRKDDSSSDDGDEDAFLKFINKSKKGESQNVSKVGLDVHMKKVIESSLEEELEWILTSLRDEAADRDEEKADDATPLVPLTPGNSQALEDAAFKSVLKFIGIRPPADEQERYWRVPEYFTPGMLREKVQALDKARQSAKTVEEAADDSSVPAKQKRIMSESNSDGVNSADDDDDPLRLVLDTEEFSPRKSPPTKRPRLDSDANSDPESAKSTQDNKKSADNSPVTMSSRWLLDSSDANSDDERPLKPVKKSPISSRGRGKPAPSSDSKTNQGVALSPPIAEKPGTLDSSSESDVENHIPQRKAAVNSSIAGKPTGLTRTLDSSSESDVEDRIPLRKVVRRPMIESDSD